MFEHLGLPLQTPQSQTILEYGCGTAALSRRIAAAAPDAVICACDKSQGMLSAAHSLVENNLKTNIRFDAWDILDESTFPYPMAKFDLSISLIVIPYLEDNQVIDLIQRLSTHLAPAGVLAFIEQDLMTDTLNYPDQNLMR